MSWEQPDLFAPKPKAKALPALTRETLDEYRANVRDDLLFNAGAMQQMIDRLDAAEAVIADLCDTYEKRTTHAERAEKFSAARKFLGRKDP